MKKIISICLLTLCLAFNISAAYSEPDEVRMLTAINFVREKNSLAPLKHNRELTRVAKYKCGEMERLGYASHFSPAYGSPAEMLNLYSVSFNTVGENIFSGSESIGGVMDAWLASPAYLKNILNPSFQEAGVGYVSNENGNSYWVALLIC